MQKGNIIMNFYTLDYITKTQSNGLIIRSAIIIVLLAIVILTSFKFMKDPAAQVGKDLLEVYQQIAKKSMQVTEAIGAQEKKLTEAKLQMEMDLPHYSDANFTMRLSYGQVGGYKIGGFNSGYYTTAESIVEKFKQANKVADYKAEPIMMKLLSSNDYGPYADKTSGQLQLTATS